MRKAILKTLVYADIFDYPLTLSEIWRFLISSQKVRQEDLQKNLDEFCRLKVTDQQNGFYFLKGREKTVLTRTVREKESHKKWQIAKETGWCLKLIPFVKMIAVSGALAMNNAKKEDDIDLLLITQKNRLWLTRLIAIFFLEVLGKRRRPNDLSFQNKICLNMFLDEDNMQMPIKEQDLFSAHEVVQIKVLWQKDHSYQRFWQKNIWVKKYLVNVLAPEQKFKESLKLTRKNNSFFLKIFSSLFNFLEILAYRSQLAYMNSRKTSETTTPGRILFHPQDARVWVLSKYQKGLKRVTKETSR